LRHGSDGVSVFIIISKSSSFVSAPRRDAEGTAMTLFRHPHLVRGIVHTHSGQFFVTRGCVDVPDEVGEALGWRRVGSDDSDSGMLQSTASTPTSAAPGRRQ
jgi:hypothetical protein